MPSGPVPMPVSPTVPTMLLPLFTVSAPVRRPGYCGLKVIGTVQIVPAALLVTPSVAQPVTAPTVNSCAPFCALGTVMLLMALAAVSSTEMFCEAEAAPTAVVGKVVLVLSSPTWLGTSPPVNSLK